MELRLDARRSSVAQARRWVADRAREESLDERTAHVVELLTSELVANAMTHGPQDGDVVVSAARRDGHFTVQVADESPTRPVVRDSPPEIPGGQGLRLVDRLASTWGVDARPPGKVVWFRVRA